MENDTNDYSQIIYEINSDRKIFNHEPKPSFSKNIDYPTFTLGFQHFIHQTKLKMDITKQFEDKKKIYLVMSKFEILIDEYDKGIQNTINKYLDTKITGRSFYKFWELLFLFDMVDLKDNDFVTVSLDDNSSNLNAVMLYRKQFGKNNKSNKYFSINVNDENIQNKKKSNNTDFTIGDNIGKNKANLIITNGMKIKNSIYSVTLEQDSYKLILNQILYALKNQNNGGTFICKIYESFTNIMAKIMTCLTCFYGKVYVVKPLTSRDINSEKYIVCQNFKKASNADVEKMEQIVEDINKSPKHKNLVDIFPNYNIDTQFNNILISLNVNISNKQFINNNEIITFINNQNYRGYEYDNKRQMQIDATAYWINQFLPSREEFIEKKKHIEGECKKIIDNNNILVDTLGKKLQHK